MAVLMRAFYLVALGVFGLVFGSFANVVIWRLPRRESVVSPGSRCPSCGHPVRPLDNVPLASWLVLRGRCRDCGAPIHWRYPLVEGLSGALWVSAGLLFGLTARAGVAIVLFYLLMILSFIDLDVMRLPNVLVVVLAVAGVVFVAVSAGTGLPLAPLTWAPAAGLFASPLASALVGAVAGSGLLALISAGYRLARGRNGLGMGDVKLMAAGGLFVGPYVLLALFLGSALATVYGLSVAGLKKQPEEGVLLVPIPFGPFLAAGLVLAAAFGPALWSAYVHALSL